MNVTLENLPAKTKAELVDIVCNLGLCRTKTEARKLPVESLRSTVEQHFRSRPALVEVSWEDTTASGESLPEPVTELRDVAPVLVAADYPALETRALARAAQSPGMLERSSLGPPLLPLLPTLPAPPSWRLPHAAATPAEAYQAAQRRKARNRRKHKRKLAGNPSGHRHAPGSALDAKGSLRVYHVARTSPTGRQSALYVRREPEGSSGFGRPL